MANLYMKYVDFYFLFTSFYLVSPVPVSLCVIKYRKMNMTYLPKSNCAAILMTMHFYGKDNLNRHAGVDKGSILTVNSTVTKLCVRILLRYCCSSMISGDEGTVQRLIAQVCIIY